MGLALMGLNGIVLAKDVREELIFLSPPDAPEIASAKSWALATTAILTERNHQRHDSLGGADLSEANVTHWKKILADWWDVNDRQGLLTALAWIEKEGHRKKFDKLGMIVAPLSDGQIEILNQSNRDEEAKNRVVIARHYFEKVGKKSILGWDYARFISLCRWGYLVGYLTEKEAWDRIMPAAELLQKTFESWNDLGENYLIGREFWSYEETRKKGQLYRATYQKLLNDCNSPWTPSELECQLNKPVNIGTLGRQRDSLCLFTRFYNF
jgi:hypothetical protein